MADIQFVTNYGELFDIKTIDDVELTPEGVDAAYRQTVHGAGGWLVGPEAESNLKDYRTSSMNENVAKLIVGEKAAFGWTDAYVVKADY